MRGKFGMIGAVSLLAISISACSAQNEEPSYQHSQSLPEYDQATFAEYQSDTAAWLKENRVFVTDNHDAEIQKVMPQEYVPQNPNGKGVILVHGLGDSPFSFVDVAQHLADQGYLVRTLLLPGHGSKVGDLMLPELKDWQGVVNHHIKLLQSEVDSVWLGGYSTGANLVTSAAIHDDAIDGLLLFSPAFEPGSSAVKWAGLASYFVTWADQDPEDNPLRYNSLPMNGAAVYYETSEVVREDLEGHEYTKPVFMIMSESDSVINTQYAFDVFKHRFTNPNNRMVWQGETPLDDDRSHQYTMNIPDLRVSNGSHMGLLFSPDNKEYGIDGDVLICSNGQLPGGEESCMQGDEVWFSSWGHNEVGKIHARLTFNPYFKQTMEYIDFVMKDDTQLAAK